MAEIRRGAEAVITIEEDVVVKDRVKKGYREGGLDDLLRKGRTKREAKLMALAKKAGVPTPIISDVDLGSCRIEMSHIAGHKVKDLLTRKMDPYKMAELCRTIGRQIGRLHSSHIIHGDLTTSNMIVSGDSVYFIDFGLGEINESVETKGVDLLVFKKALHSAHWEVADQCFSAMVGGYSEAYPQSSSVLERLRVIERRGRYITERG